MRGCWERRGGIGCIVMAGLMSGDLVTCESNNLYYMA